VTSKSNTVSYIRVALLAGMIAGAIMIVYAMFASLTILDQGICTPLYSIASPLIGKRPMMMSMQQHLYFNLGPVGLGVVIHLLWAALYGIIFGLLVRDFQLRGAKAVISGLLYSVLVMLFMSFVVLPIVGVSGMPTMVGWPSFTVEHLLFGLMLGLGPMLRPQEFAVAVQHAPRTTALCEYPIRSSPISKEVALSPFTRAGQPMRLEVYVSSQCGNCDEALLIAERAFGIAGLEVVVVDIDAPDCFIPPSVVAVPTYILNGRVVSMGNPSREAFLAELHRWLRST
jgi:hypothetical protein